MFFQSTVTELSIVQSIEDGILIIQFNEPSRHNPFNRRREADVIDALTRAQTNPLVKAIIITGGEGASFSAGGDFREVKEFTGGDEVDEWVERIMALYQAPLSSKKPVIAAIDCHAIGMGLQFALMSDFRVGTHNTKLTMPELKNNLSCTLGGSILTKMFGVAIAQEMIYSGDAIPVDHAIKCGLLHEVVEPGKLMEAAISKANLMKNYPAAAFGNTKRVLTAPVYQSLHEGMQVTKEACRQAFAAGDPQAFMKEVTKSKTATTLIHK